MPRLKVRVTGPKCGWDLRADEVIAQWVWFPVGGELRLAWLFDAVPADGETYYECVVDATNGALLYRNSITDSENVGLVFDGASPQPSTTPGVLPPDPQPAQPRPPQERFVCRRSCRPRPRAGSAPRARRSATM